MPDLLDRLRSAITDFAMGWRHPSVTQVRADVPVWPLLEQLQEALVDRYAVEREIGSGGMAVVFRAHDLKHDRDIALKVLRPELSSRLGRQRFLREIRLAARLNHPHILPLYDSGEVGEFLYFVMPYVEGESLRTRLRREHRLEPGEAIEIAREVAAALDYAHRHDVIHRDIKPENIMIHDGTALVADFGIGKALSAAGGARLTQAGAVVGTPAYMSPEQIFGESLTGRSDLYSLGCVVYEMLTGKQVCSATTPHALVAQHMADHVRDLEFPESVPLRVRTAVRATLEEEPENRPATGAELADALGEPSACAGEPCGTPTDQGAVSRAKSIVVLPFTNMSGDPENEYFSDGITDDIITQLSKIGGLKVTSRTSAMCYKDTTKSLREIGGELGVGTVLEGSVRRVGKRVRIVSQLIDVEQDAHIWAETYDRDLTDIFEIQSDVAGRIADALQLTLSSVAKASIKRKPTEDLDAYEHYLKGVYYWNKLTWTSEQKAIKHFEEAIERDPNFALAHAGLADAYWILGVADDSPFSPSEVFGRAKAAAERALECDPTLSGAHATLGSVYFWYEWDWEAAERAFTRAVSLSCGCDEPHIKYAYYLAGMGRQGEAIHRAEEALRLDPVSLVASANLAWHYYWAREFDRAAERAHKTLELDAAFWPAQLILGLAKLQQRDVMAAIPHLKSAVRATEQAPACLSALGSAYAVAGRGNDANAMLSEIQDLSTTQYASPVAVACVYVSLGHMTEALDWLEKAYAQRATWMALLRVDPEWDALREEARFKALLERMAFPPT